MATMSIWRRPGDLGLVGFFLFALYFALFMDILNPLAPTGEITADVLKVMSWPPGYMRDLFAFWTLNADLVLVQNPFWYQIVCAYSPLIYAPFYVVASYAFVYQRNWIRIPAVVWAGMMLGALPPVFLQELFGYTADFPDHPSQTVYGKAAFLAGYGGFLVVPLVVIARMWEEPFPKRE